MKTIAFYLPQFYPTPENDIWWGKGFTEWTNVGRAKPLFRDHYQPRVPADLGYYDLRIPEVRLLQAEMAREAGIYGFCYWHYWFAGRRLLNRVFDEVVKSGEPNFPFCLCWANHSWKAKTWDPEVPDKMLMEQTYPGEEDYVHQFEALLPAFTDERYIRVDGRLLYGIFEPSSHPDIKLMADIWNGLARQHGIEGFYFFGFVQGSGNLAGAQSPVYDAIVYDTLFDAVYQNLQRFGNKVKAKLNPLFKQVVPLPYDFYVKTALQMFCKHSSTIPCIDPDFDHSPRSGRKGVIMHGSTPEKWGLLCKKTCELIEARGKEELLFIKSWNEWGEGNYLEPDLRFGTGYLNELAKVLKG